MPLKPRRFWLSTIAVCISGLLMWLEKALHAQNFLSLLNDVVNLPAFAVFIQIAAGLHPDGSNFPSSGWLAPAVYLVLVGLCWYVVGLELDFCLFRRIAAKGRMFRFCWMALSAGLQGAVIWAVCLFLMEVVRHKPPEPFDPVMSGFFLTIELSWVQLTALRLWKEQKQARKDSTQ